MSKFSVLIEHFKQYFDFCGATELEIGFRYGAFSAISIILFLTILILLFRFVFFRKRQIRQIELDGTKGKYVISASAITDLLASKIAEYPEISLLKTKIFPVKSKIQIIMHINYIPQKDAENLKDLIAGLQENAIKVLDEVFGIQNIDSVSVSVSRARSK